MSEELDLELKEITLRLNFVPGKVTANNRLYDPANLAAIVEKNIEAKNCFVTMEAPSDGATVSIASIVARVLKYVTDDNGHVFLVVKPVDPAYGSLEGCVVSASTLCDIAVDPDSNVLHVTVKHFVCFFLTPSGNECGS